MRRKPALVGHLAGLGLSRFRSIGEKIGTRCTARKVGLAVALVFGISLGAPMAMPLAAEGVAVQGSAQAGMTSVCGISVDASGGGANSCAAGVPGCFGDLSITIP
jgi:hypothetical protein